MSMIREQYHFRPSPNGFYAWDVQKLVALSAKQQPEKVLLRKIGEIDEACWFGGPGTNVTCWLIAEHAWMIYSGFEMLVES